MNPYSNTTLLEDRIYAASPVGLTLILMEQAVASIRAIRQSLTENDVRRRAREVNRLLDILSELILSLKADGTAETGKRRRIYSSLQAMLIDAHAQVKPETFATVEASLTSLLDNWKEVCNALEGSAPVSATPDAFEEWTAVFGSERLTGALLDRLTHHVHILAMNGVSYRLAQSTARRRQSKKAAPGDAVAGGHFDQDTGEILSG
jgi:flagellar biosynthetic protein FliS